MVSVCRQNIGLHSGAVCQGLVGLPATISLWMTLMGSPLWRNKKNKRKIHFLPPMASSSTAPRHNGFFWHCFCISLHCTCTYCCRLEWVRQFKWGLKRHTHTPLFNNPPVCMTAPLAGTAAFVIADSHKNHGNTRMPDYMNNWAFNRWHTDVLLSGTMNGLPYQHASSA